MTISKIFRAALGCMTVAMFVGSADAAGIIVAAADDGRVTVLDQSDPKRAISTFFPFNTGGVVFVAAGDVTADGVDDIVAAMDGTIKVFNARGEFARSLQPFGPAYRGGLRVALGDVNGDGRLDIISGNDANGVTVRNGFDGSLLMSFEAYDRGFSGGVYVAAGDLNGDGRAEIVTGPGLGAGPHVKIFSGNGDDVVQISSFYAYDPAFRGGVRVAVGDVNKDGFADVVTGPGPGMPAVVNTYSGTTMVNQGALLVYDPTFQGGVFVASGPLSVTPGAPAGGVSTIQTFDGAAHRLVPFPGYGGGLTIAASAGATGSYRASASSSPSWALGPTTRMTALVVNGEDPVVLQGTLDGSNNLQLKHGADSLANYDQTLHARHNDLRTPGGTIRIKLMDFSYGGETWTITASHFDGATVNWLRGSDHAYFDFRALTSELQVDVKATSNSSPAKTKTLTNWIKTMPTDGQ